MAIHFYRSREQYGCFSNFSLHSFEANGRRWKTSEHFFQAQKFLNSPEHFDRVWMAKSPSDAALLGRDRNSPLRSDWESVKDSVMKQALLAKFRQNNLIQLILLSTDGKQLVEKTSNDYYWGCGSNNTGRNMLGKLLMEVRDELKLEKDKNLNYLFYGY